LRTPAWTWSKLYLCCSTRHTWSFRRDIRQQRNLQKNHTVTVVALILRFDKMNGKAWRGTRNYRRSL
jgi:hypothetical protein